MTVEYDRGELAGVIAKAITNHLMSKIQPSTAATIRDVLEESSRLSFLTSATLHPEFETNPEGYIHLFKHGCRLSIEQLIGGILRPRIQHTQKT